MVTLWVEKACATVTEICRLATWLSVNTLIRHYRVDIQSSAEASFGRKLLLMVASNSITSVSSLSYFLFLLSPFFCSLSATSHAVLQIVNFLPDDNLLSASSVSHNSTLPGWLPSQGTVFHFND